MEKKKTEQQQEPNNNESRETWLDENTLNEVSSDATLEDDEMEEEDES